MAGQGSTGNVIAALASFFIPGLGQLLQGRLAMVLFILFLLQFYGFLCWGGSFIFGLSLTLQDIKRRLSFKEELSGGINCKK